MARQVTWFEVTRPGGGRRQNAGPGGAAQHVDVDGVDGAAAQPDVAADADQRRVGGAGAGWTAAAAAVLDGRVAARVQPAADLDAAALAEQAVRLSGVDEASIGEPHARHGRVAVQRRTGERRQPPQCPR